MLITEGVKVGDIVWFDGWGGVIGKVREVGNEELTIEWPNNSFFSSKVQRFYDGNKEPIKVHVLKTPKEVFDKMAELFNSWHKLVSKPIRLKPNVGYLLAYENNRGR